MARAELLINLFRNYVSHDDAHFRAVALEIIAEEEQKKNHALAKELLKILQESSLKSVKKESPTPSSTISLVDIYVPGRRQAELVVPQIVHEKINRIVDEYKRKELLKIHQLRPKRKILLYGPPGCGKTLSAEIIASELKLPILYTRFDSVVSSYLGETSSNLRKVFDYAKSGSWVVFFDEFDTIGKSRTDPNEHGELKRVVNTFLQMLDRFESDSIVIAATNNPEVLDHALWRRFDEIILFEKPGEAEIQQLIELKLKSFPHSPSISIKTPKRLQGFSHADIERICYDSIKSAILNDCEKVTLEIFEQCISQQISRVRTDKNMPRS